MRLSDAVFNASDNYHESLLLPLYELMLKGGYGHIMQPRFRCETDNNEMSVIEMNVTALTPAGRLINVIFDHNERNLFQKMSMPDSHEPFIVYLEQSASEFDTFEDKEIPYKDRKINLMFKGESVSYANPDAVAVARFEYKQCWMMDNSFIAPCLSLKANADLWNLGHVYLRILTDLSAALQTKTSSEMGAEVLSLIPVVSALSTEVRKEMDEMSPKHLITIMQQVVCAVVAVFRIRRPEVIAENDACAAYVETEYVSNRIEPLVNEGIRLTRILVQTVGELHLPVVVEPEPQPVVPRIVRQPRTLDTSSERKSFKQRK